MLSHSHYAEHTELNFTFFFKFNVAIVTLKAVGATGELPGGDELQPDGAGICSSGVQTISAARDDETCIAAITAAIAATNKDGSVCPSNAAKVRQSEPIMLYPLFTLYTPSVPYLHLCTPVIHVYTPHLHLYTPLYTSKHPIYTHYTTGTPQARWSGSQMEA